MGSIARPGRGTRVPDPIVQKILPGSLAFIPSTTDFEGFAKQQIGTLGTGQDGFDALFSPAASAIDDDIKALTSFDGDLSGAAFNEGEFAQTYHAPVDPEITALLNDGDQLNQTVQNPGQISVDPVVTPPPPPPGSGGGSEGAGGSGGGSVGGSGGGEPPTIPGNPDGSLPGWDIPDPSGNTPIDFPGDGGGAGGGDDPTIIWHPPHPVIL